MSDFTYKFLRTLQIIALKTFSTWSIQGSENVPPKGSLLIVANHLSCIDPSLLACAIPRRLYFLAKKEVFRPVIGNILIAYGAFPIDRKSMDRKALLWSSNILNEDKSLVVFPEGQRNPIRKMQKPFGGAAMLALKTQSVILPVGITGSESIGPLWRMALPTGKIAINIGYPFTLPHIEGRISHSLLNSFSETIMQRIANLIPKNYQGIYKT
jgi:1-acyl-sn-glycerol-3-phosphate acyltransferase